MRIFNKLVIYIFFTLLNYVAIAQEHPILIEFKEFGDNNAIIFFHDDTIKIKISYTGNRVAIATSEPVIVKSNNKEVIDQHISNFKLSRDKKVITFSTKGNYLDSRIVYGERLSAIRFRKSEQKPSNEITNTIDKLTVPGSKDVRVSYINEKKEYIAVFTFADDEIGSASFLRNNNLWIFFDEEKNFNISALEQFGESKIFTGKGYTAIKIKLNDKKHAFLEKKGKNWNLKLSSKEYNTKDIKLEKFKNGTGLFFKLTEPGRIIEFQDPEIGDNISVVTIKNSGESVRESKFYMDFSSLETYQGIVISWLSDKHNMYLRSRSVDIKFKLSTEIAKKKISESDNLKTLMTQDYFKEKDDNFIKTQSLFRQRLASSDDESFSQILYDFAEFYFLEELYYEAYSLINLIPVNNNKFTEQNYKFYFLSAAIFSRLGYYDSAIKALNILSNFELHNNLKQEIIMWNNYIKSKKGDHSKEIGILNMFNQYLNHYPSEIYWDLVMTELTYAQENTNIELLTGILRQVKKTEDDYYKNKINNFRAFIASISGNIDAAVKIYEEVKSSTKSDENYAKAEFELVKLLVNSRKISTSEAIDRLNNLRFRWRGDKIEFNILLETSKLYREENKFVESIRTSKYLISVFPYNPTNFSITRDMARIYNNNIFSKGGLAEKLDDFEVVSIFYEFRDLTPIGSQGDEVILSVARRLLNLDLLEEVENLLSHQVRYRLEGHRRVITADHLAAIYLLNGKPKEAIEVLSDTDNINFSYKEHINRKKLMAKAYYDLSDYKRSISFIENMDEDDAIAIKRDIYFKTSKWDDYIRITEPDIIPQLEIGRKILDDQTSVVLRLAIAYSMSGKIKELKNFKSILKTDNKALINAIEFMDIKNQNINISQLDRQFDINVVDKYFKSVVKEMFGN